jgi:putative SOS response-associated peptidase YedK
MGTPSSRCDSCSITISNSNVIILGNGGVAYMCGRFTLTATMEELLDRFDIGIFTDQEDYTPSYNIAPSQRVIAVINDGQKNKMGYLKWGLLPPWAKDKAFGNKLINARSESLLEKPSFRTAFQKKRCLIIADSFYEWKRGNEKNKTPMRIKLKSNQLFAMAGLWERWQSPEGTSLFTCTVITTSPNLLVKEIHDRMPVILQPKDEKIWLDPSIQDPRILMPLLVPLQENLMDAYEVSSMVNSPTHNTIDLIQEIC